MARMGGDSNSLDRQAMVVHEGLFALYDRMLGDVKMPAVLRDVADVVCQEVGAERATIYLIEEETHELASVAVIGNVARTIRVAIREDSLAGYCALKGRSFVVPDAYGDLGAIDPKLRFDPAWDQVNSFRTRDVICAPARFKDQTLGVVQAVNSTGEPFCDKVLPSLESISRLIGYALYHAKLYDDLATMKKLEKEKAEFMRIMVHELKSPVAAARMLSDAMKAQHPGQPQIASMTEKISGRMDQMIGLVRDILDLAKTKSGKPLGDVIVLDLTAETKSGCELYQDQARQKGLAMHVELPEGPLPVRFDSQGYPLVLSNLVSNAVKYTQAGSVRVHLAREDGWAVLTVRDTGIGVPETEIPRLFSEFFRASNAKKQRIPGSGVGLAGVKQLVERFGGELAMESRLDEGSTFIVRLPLHTDGAGEAESQNK